MKTTQEMAETSEEHVVRELNLLLEMTLRMEYELRTLSSEE